MKVITTVGTSIFENNNIDFSEIKNQSFSEWNKHDDEIKMIKNSIKKLDSAEISSIEKLKDKYSDLKIILLASDTLESVLASEIIREYLKEKNIYVEFDRSYASSVIKDLRIDGDFEQGVENLIHKIIGIHKVNDKKYDFSNTVFNITGGFKVIIIYLSLIAQVTSSEILYMFEESNVLLNIPIYPISFDDRIADLYLPYLNKHILNNIKQDSEVLNKLDGLKFIKKENENYKLTELGNFFKILMNYKSTYFGDLIEYLLFSYFAHKNSYKTIEQGKKYSINDKTGDFDIYIERDNEIEIKEIKSIGQIDKFIDKQAQKYIEWLKQNFNKKKKLTLLLYLVEENLLELFKDKLQQLEKKLVDVDIELNIEYLIIPLNNLNSFIKEFGNIEIKKYNLKG